MNDFGTLLWWWWNKTREPQKLNLGLFLHPPPWCKLQSLSIYNSSAGLFSCRGILYRGTLPNQLTSIPIFVSFHGFWTSVRQRFPNVKLVPKSRNWFFNTLDILRFITTECYLTIAPCSFQLCLVFLKPKLSNLSSKADAVFITSNLVLIVKEILLSNLNTAFCQALFFNLKVRPRYLGRIKEVFHSCLANKSSTFFTAFCGHRSVVVACINLGIDPNIPLLVSMEENSVET